MKLKITILALLVLLVVAAFTAPRYGRGISHSHPLETHNGPGEVHNGDWSVEFKIADGKFSRIGSWDTLAECQREIPKLVGNGATPGAHCVQFIIDKDGHTFFMGSHDPAWTH